MQQLPSTKIKDGDVGRVDMNTATSGKAVTTKVIAGTSIALSSTGADAGTGDVTVSLSKPEGIFDNAIINGNMQVSQRGNFTTAITSSSGLANNKFYLDRWKYGVDAGNLSVASLQRSAASISGHPELTNAVKLVGNSSGSPVTGYISYFQNIEDYALFKGKTVTASFWARSNLTTNFQVYFADGVVSAVGTNLDTNSGDGVWRHYKISQSISAGATNLRLGFAISTTNILTAFSIPAGGYIEITGVRLYEGTDELPALVRTYDDELKKCLRYCQGADGETGYKAGYSIYNISGVATSTWRNSINALNLFQVQMLKAGSGSTSQVFLPSPLCQSNGIILTVYTFDNATTTGGGTGSSGKISLTDAAGTTTHAVAISAPTSYNNLIVISQSANASTITAVFTMCIELESF